MWKELVARGIRVGKERVRKLMQRHGIKARGKRIFVVTTDSKHNLPRYPVYGGLSTSIFLFRFRWRAPTPTPA